MFGVPKVQKTYPNDHSLARDIMVPTSKVKHRIVSTNSPTAERIPSQKYHDICVTNQTQQKQSSSEQAASFENCYDIF